MGTIKTWALTSAAGLLTTIILFAVVTSDPLAKSIAAGFACAAAGILVQQSILAVLAQHEEDANKGKKQAKRQAKTLSRECLSLARGLDDGSVSSAEGQEWFSELMVSFSELIDGSDDPIAKNVIDQLQADNAAAAATAIRTLRIVG
jgi:hypothetical protein